MKMKKTIGLMGAGNMGTAILEGLLKKGLAAPGRVYVYDKVRAKALRFSKKWKTRTASSGEALLECSQIVLLAVKPQDLTLLGPSLRPRLKASHVLISILAGMPIKKIEKYLGRRAKIVRSMPNLGAKVGHAVVALTGGGSSALALAEKVFKGCGKTVRLPEKDFDLVTAISGSGPAYFFLMMELLAEAGRRRGLSRKTAELLAVQTAAGAGFLAQTSVFAPAKLREMVTSKKGTTDAALKIFKAQHFSSTVQKAVDAALKRGRELSRS